MKGDKKMTKQEMKRREAVEKWLDKHIKMMNKRNSSDIELDDGTKLQTCGQTDYIQLYNCVEHIAKTLTYLTVNTEESGDRTERSFIYKGVKFLEV